MVWPMRRAALSDFRATHFDFDYALGTFAIRHDLQRQRAADFLKRFRESTMRGRTRFDRGRTRSAVGSTSSVSFVDVSPSMLMALKVRVVTSRRVFCSRDGEMLASVATNASVVAIFGMNHARALGTANQMDALAGHFEGSAGGFRASVRGADGQREFRETSARKDGDFS